MAGKAVYSLSLRNTCIFEFILEEDATETINHLTLKGGMMLVFGGSQRLMRHRVREVQPSPFPFRIKLTFRTCTNLTIEDEARFQTEEYVKRIRTQRKTISSIEAVKAISLVTSFVRHAPKTFIGHVMAV
jgi:hypothetical protein